MPGKVSSNPNEFLLPDLGEGLQEAELIEWCVQPGQEVHEFDILAKMETDKALVEVPSPRAGVIKELRGKPGEKLKVGDVLVVYEGGGAPAIAKARPAAAEAARSATAPQKTDAPQGSMDPEAEREDAGTVVGSLSKMVGVDTEGKVRAAPAVRRLARDLGVDIETIQGSGIGGRVTSKDVQAAAAPRPISRPGRADVQPKPAVRGSRAASAPADLGVNGKEVERIPFRGMRRTIAERLRNSVNFAVHFNVMDEADVSALDAMRRKLSGAAGEKLSLLPFVAAAVCRVLAGREGASFGMLNSTVDDEHQEIVHHRSVHLGIATDTESGLMVPVIRDAQTLGVLELARQIAAQARAARERSIPREQLVGSTFTISNVGSYAGRFATPIINYPEVGILGVGRAREAVVVRDGMIGIGQLLPLSLAADHRVVDGATAAKALAKVIELLQEPERLLESSAA